MTARLSGAMRKRRIGTAKFFTLLLLLYHTSAKGAGTKRARFNSSLLDLNSLRKGSGYEKLPESYVIFITENDVWQHGLARYHVNRIIEELNRPFEDAVTSSTSMAIIREMMISAS